MNATVSGKFAGRCVFLGRWMVKHILGCVQSERRTCRACLIWTADILGADRSFFLRRRWILYPELSKVLVEDGRVTGYILGRRGEGWMAVGPWVVEPGIKHPQQLLEALAVVTGNQMFSVGILESNRRAVEIIQTYGFVERADGPWRMALGPDDNLGASLECLAVGTAAKG
jgi:hypothetical protein